jgi:DNA mismatch repair protein MutS2
MNEHTEAVLDFIRIKHELQTYTVTSMGTSLAAVLRPQTAPAGLEIQLQETSEMVARLAAGEAPPLAPIADIQAYLEAARVEGMYLEGTQLLEVAACLEVVQRLRRYEHEATVPAPQITRRLSRLADVGILLRQLRHALDEKGQVRDHASPELLHLRQTLRRLRERVNTRLRDLMTTHRAVVQDPIVTIRNDRFVIPIKAEFQQVLRGIVHGESASGATVYVEPDSVVDLNNQLLRHQAEEERAVRAVLRELTSRFAVQSVALKQALQITGEIDFICAKGRLSQRMQGAVPRFAAESQVQLLAARHPLLEAPVPIDVRLGPGSRTLVVTGPNTGGKTAALKTVGLLVLMAQAGLHIPADPDSVLSVFTDVFVDLGDEQSLQQNLSTFAAHMANICAMMRQASARSLLLLDELGAGTDPMEGGPLGVAILDYFHAREAITLATTHHSVIKAYAMSAPHVGCATVEFDMDSLQPHYRLVYGLPGRSQAFAIARKLGVPSSVIERAQQEAGMIQVRNEQLLERLEVHQQALEDERRHLRSERAEIDRLHRSAQQAHARAVAEEQRIRQALYDEGQTLLKTARQELDATLATLRRQARTDAQIAFPHDAWQRMEQAVASLAPAALEAAPPSRPFEVGETVRVRRLNIVGRLRTAPESNNQVQVEVGDKTLTIAASDLERVDEQTAQRSSGAPGQKPRQARQPAKQGEAVSPELRLRGYTVAEATPVVEKYLDQAFVHGLERVRLVHGVGSGRLRAALGELLDRHPLVRRFQAGDAGGGVTIVELER